MKLFCIFGSGSDVIFKGFFSILTLVAFGYMNQNRFAISVDL